jgi:hypothetical protein
MASVADQQTASKAEISANLFTTTENKTTNEAGVDYSSIRGKVCYYFFCSFFTHT